MELREHDFVLTNCIQIPKETHEKLKKLKILKKETMVRIIYEMVNEEYLKSTGSNNL